MLDIQSLKIRACSAIDDIAQDLVEASHTIHENPELNYEEFIASELLVRLANKHGLTTDKNAFGCETGFVGEAGTGPTVCIMSEYDALPVIGHGCGHNIIGSAGLGAAIALSLVANDAGGRLRFLGTPAEEGGGGKLVMARNGALDGVDIAMMVHSADADLTSIDAIALQQLLVEYGGEAAHAAAAPEKGKNALDAAVLGYMAVSALRQHMLPSERVHGIFIRGGSKPNIVPHDAATEWYVRSDTMSSLQELKPRVLSALEAGAHACGCSFRHEWDPNPYADMVTNNNMSAMYIDNAASLGRSVVLPGSNGHRVVGSTDMGNISHLVPSIHPMIASAPSGTAIHTTAFEKASRSLQADQAVIDGAKIMAMTAIDYWTSPQQQTAISAEFALTNPSRDVL